MSIAKLEAYIADKPGSPFLADARNRIAELRKKVQVEQQEAEVAANAQAAWGAVKGTTSIPALEAFIIDNPRGPLVADARNRIAELGRTNPRPLPDDTKDCQSYDDPALRVAACSRLLKHTPGGTARAKLLHDRAFGHSQLHDDEAAIADWSAAIRLDPKNADYYSWRAPKYAARGQFALALEDDTTLIQMDPKYTSRVTSRGRTYETMGDWDRALQGYTQAIRLEAKAGYGARASAYLRMGAFDKALADADELIRLDPQEGYSTRADILMPMGQIDRAFEAYAKAIAAAPHNSTLYSKRAAAYIAKKEFSRALDDYAKALHLSTDNASVQALYLIDRAQALYKQGEQRAAFDDLRQAMVLDPTDKGTSRSALHARAEIHAAQGNWELALREYDVAIADLPNQPWTYLERAQAHVARGNWERAFDDYAQALRLRPKAAFLYAARSKAFGKRGDWFRALEDAEQVVRTQSARRSL